MRFSLIESIHDPIAVFMARAIIISNEHGMQNDKMSYFP